MGKKDAKAAEKRHDKNGRAGKGISDKPKPEVSGHWHGPHFHAGPCVGGAPGDRFSL